MVAFRVTSDLPCLSAEDSMEKAGRLPPRRLRVLDGPWIHCMSVQSPRGLCPRRSQAASRC